MQNDETIAATKRATTDRDSGQQHVIEPNCASKKFFLTLVKELNDVFVYDLTACACQNSNTANDQSFKPRHTLKYGGGTNKNVHSGRA